MVGDQVVLHVQPVLCGSDVDDGLVGHLQLAFVIPGAGRAVTVVEDPIWTRFLCPPDLRGHANERLIDGQLQ